MNEYKVIIKQGIQGKADYKQKWLYILKSLSHETSTSKE